MTRKRYIKLLMGKLELSRNEARDRAARVVCTKNKFDASDKTLKALGKKTRLGTVSYAEAWDDDVQSYTWVKKRALEIKLEEKFKSWKTSR
jgi:hypothetical protein